MFRMPQRRDRALTRLICQMAYRDAVETQMEALADYKQGIQSVSVNRMLSRELARLRGEFNMTQAQIESMRGRMLPVVRERIVTEDAQLDLQAAFCNCNPSCRDCALETV